MNKLLIGIGVLLILAIGPAYQLGTQETVIIEVTGKERVNNGNSSKYLIFTENETFRNTDALWHLKFSSSDLYGQLDETTYEAKVYGWRVPFFSMYRNIVSVNQGQ